MNLSEINQLNDEMTKKYNLPINFVMMNRSDHYPAAYFRSSLFILALTYLIFYFIPFDIQDPIWLIGLSIPAVVVGQLLPLFDRYKKVFISRTEMKEECYQQALEQSYQLGVLNESNSIFLFVSLFEKRIELFIPDSLKEKNRIKEVKGPFKKLVKDLKKDQFLGGLREFYQAILIENAPKEIKTDEIKEAPLPLTLVEKENEEKSSQPITTTKNPYNLSEETIINKED